MAFPPPTVLPIPSVGDPFSTSSASTPAETSTTTSDTPTSTSSSSTTTTTSSSTTTSSTSSTTSTTSTTTSSTSTSDTSSSTSTTSSTSSTSSTTSTSTSTSSSQSFTTSREVTVTGSNGAVTVVTQTQTDTGALPTTSESSDATTGSKTFFDNKGAVAGVFTVVGLVGLVLFVALITNAIRRRRAKKFDDEVAAAAAEAAATAPRYPFDDEYDSAPGGGSKYGVGSYSDIGSHGTLSQPPMAVGGESYNMTEFSGFNPSFGAGGVAAGAGMMGAGAAAVGAGPNRSLSRRDPAANYADYGNGAGNIAGFGSGPTHVQAHQAIPYTQPQAFDAFSDDAYDRYAVPNSGLHRNPTHGAADFGAIAPMGTAIAGDPAVLNRGPSQNGARSLTRAPSQGATSSLSGGQDSSAPTQESYAAHYAANFKPDEHKYAPPVPAVPPTVPTPGATSGSSSEPASLPNPFAKDAVSDEDAYGAESYYPMGRDSHDESRASIRDEEDYGRAGRTLKVANE